MRVRLHVGPNAFGNALGSAIAAAINPTTKSDEINDRLKVSRKVRADLEKAAIEYGGDYNQIPAGHPALLAAFGAVKDNTAALKIASTDPSKVGGFRDSFDSNGISGTAPDTSNEMSVEITATRGQVIYEKTVQGVAIAGGSLAGMAQAVGDTIIGTGKLALDMLDASDYIMMGGDSKFNRAVGGFAERKQSFENLVGIGKAMANPSELLGNMLGTTIDGVQNALDQANQTEDLSDWFLYGAKVGHATVDAALFVTGIGGIARGLTAGFSQIRSIAQAVRAADVSASPFLSELSVGARVSALGKPAEEVGRVVNSSRMLSSRTGKYTGIAEFDIPFSQSPHAAKMMAGMERRGFTLIDDVTKLDKGAAAHTAKIDGQIAIIYDSNTTTYLDMLHEARHGAQMQRVEAANVLGNRVFLKNSRIIAAAERGAYSYELRVGKSRGFSEDYMNWAQDRIKDYYRPAIADKFRKSLSMGPIFRAMEPGLNP